MEIVKEEVYSRLPNKFFYTNDKSKSILEDSKDDKLLLIMHYLYILSNYEFNCIINLEYLMKRCGYKPIKKNVDSFNKSLKYLKKKEYISYQGSDISLKELIVIDTTNLLTMCDKGEFTLIQESELDILKNFNTNSRSLLNHAKVYFNIKARIYKPSNNFDWYDEDGRNAIATYMTYDRIEIESKVSRNYIKRYLNNLETFNMITIKNFQYRYGKGKYDNHYKESPNVITINNLECFTEKKTTIDSELNLMFKEFKISKEDEGYTFIKISKELNELNMINHRKTGYLGMFVSQGKATKEQEEEYKKRKSNSALT